MTTRPAPSAEAHSDAAAQGRPAPRNGLLLRLTAPLQSWGELSHFHPRDTAAFPTRSGVLGLLAAALGRPRDHPVDDLTRLSLTVRADRPGIVMEDLHTVGGGLPNRETVTTAEGKKRSGDTSTLVSHRAYLADAAFTVALTTEAPQDDAPLLAQCAEALRSPRWPLYLGRRACPPEGPLLLGCSDDALHHLVALPLAATQPRGIVQGVEYLSDQPLHRLPVPASLTTPDSEDGDHSSSQINDDPLSYHPRHRAYRARALYRRTLRHPASAYVGLGHQQLRALADYITVHLTHTFPTPARPGEEGSPQ